MIEVMAAMLLLSIMVLGITGLWTRTMSSFFDLRIKQKAVLALNGEMERLATLYRFTDFAESGDVILTEGYGSPTITGLSAAELPSDRNVYETQGAAAHVTGTYATFVSELGYVYTYDPTGGTDPLARRNVLLLDLERNISARVAWTVEALPQPCYDSDQNCYRLTVYLDFPYRNESESDPLVASFSAMRTLSLQTIVGRRL